MQHIIYRHTIRRPSTYANSTSFARHIDDEKRLLLTLVVGQVYLVTGSILNLEIEDGGGGCPAGEGGRDNQHV